jgi:hypothetical protein
MTRRGLYAVLLAVFLLVCAAAWYLFRPEKAFINDEVDEPFPGEVSPGSAPRAEPGQSPGAPVSRSGGRSLCPCHTFLLGGGLPC